jgi:hypothetical protein
MPQAFGPNRGCDRSCSISLHLNMLETVPLIALFNPADANGVRTNLVGFQAWSLGRTRLWGVQKTVGPNRRRTGPGIE